MLWPMRPRTTPTARPTNKESTRNEPAPIAIQIQTDTVLYLTRGERGIRDRGLEEAAKIRSAEAEQACKIMGTRPAFFGQIDGDTRLTREEMEKMGKWVASEKPDVVFAHWPIDTHMDHQVASVLAMISLSSMPHWARANLRLRGILDGERPLPNFFDEFPLRARE